MRAHTQIYARTSINRTARKRTLRIRFGLVCSQIRIKYERREPVLTALDATRRHFSGGHVIPRKTRYNYFGQFAAQVCTHIGDCGHGLWKFKR